MRVSPVTSITDLTPITSITKPSETEASNGGMSFSETVKKAIGSVNTLQSEADEMARKLATGELEDVHQAVLAMNKAKLAFDFTLAVRNKVLEAYQEIMRTQV
jgi:flagellar hook-basal body complex protein FliE